jgi:hypothetical protein
MIAITGYFKFKNKEFADFSVAPYARSSFWYLRCHTIPELFAW